jgi:putative transposase
VWEGQLPLAVPAASNQVWSMDLMHDKLEDGRQNRLFSVLDNLNRKGLGIEVELSLPAVRVIRSLDQIIEWRRRPKAIRCDNGPEHLGAEKQAWSKKRGVKIDYVQPGTSQQNAYVERLNRTIRYDWLSQTLFASIEEVQNAATPGSGRITTTDRPTGGGEWSHHTQTEAGDR